VLRGHVANELLDDDRLARAGAPEDRGLTAFEERADQVNDLHPGLEDLGGGGLIGERRRLAVDRVAPFALHRALAVDGLADDIEHAAEGLLADRDGDGLAGVDGLHPAAQPVGALHRDRPDPVVAEMLLDLGDDEVAVIALHREGVVDLRKLTLLEAHVQDRSDDLDYFAGLRSGLRRNCHLVTPSSLRRPKRSPTSLS
jgi:hypothetical protein